MVEMQCLLQMSPSTILMGGHQDKLILFDISRAEEDSVVIIILVSYVSKFLISTSIPSGSSRGEWLCDITTARAILVYR